MTPYEEAEDTPKVGVGLVKRGLLAMVLVVATAVALIATTSTIASSPRLTRPAPTRGARSASSS